MVDKEEAPLHLLVDMKTLQMALAIASMVRGELLWIYRHHPYSTGLTKVKLKKGLTEKDLQLTPSQVAEMIGILEMLGALIEEHSSIIRQYYHEYLLGAHKTAYEQSLPEVSANVLWCHMTSNNQGNL